MRRFGVCPPVQHALRITLEYIHGQHNMRALHTQIFYFDNPRDVCAANEEKQRKRKGWGERERERNLKRNLERIYCNCKT